MDTTQLNYWIAGFCAGEACFFFGVYVRQPSYHSLTCCFSIKVRGDERPVLETIQQVLGCGYITEHPAHKHTQPASKYQVTKVEDLALRVIPFFEKYPLFAKKEQDFQVFKRGIQMAYNISRRPIKRTDKAHGASRWTPEDWAVIKQLAEQLKDSRTYKIPHTL